MLHSIVIHAHLEIRMYLCRYKYMGSFEPNQISKMLWNMILH